MGEYMGEGVRKQGLVDTQPRRQVGSGDGWDEEASGIMRQVGS
jgi:hypothetical protein